MTTGFIATLIVAPILLIIAVVLFLWALGFYLDEKARGDYADDKGLALFLTCAAGLGIAGVIVGFALGTLPWHMEYHSVRTHAGIVSENKQVQYESDWVITFQGSTVQYDCGETRCAAAQPGDHLSLRCTKVGIWKATDYYDCNFGSLTRRS
jgi:hypothetical protein